MNDKVKRYITGQFTSSELQKYLAIGFGFFLTCILLARLTFPAENDYRIAYDTFSFLGSFDSDNNPVGWFFFTIGLIFWGIFSLPIMIYITRRFQPVAKGAANFGGMFLILGAVGMILVGIFPDAHSLNVVGDVSFSDIHGKVSLIAFGGLGLGLLWFGLLLAKDRFLWFPKGGQNLLNHKKVIWPYLMFIVIFGLATFFLVRWEFVYPVLEAADPTIGSHWGAALGTVYSFPLWENIAIYMIIVFMAWFPLMLPGEIPKKE